MNEPTIWQRWMHPRRETSVFQILNSIKKEVTVTQAGSTKPMMGNRIIGPPKWFNVKHDYGFIVRNDIHEDTSSTRVQEYIHEYIEHQSRAQKLEKQTALCRGRKSFIRHNHNHNHKGASATNVTLIDGKLERTACTNTARNWRHCRCPD